MNKIDCLFEQDIIDPSSALGLTSNNIAEQDINIEKENVSIKLILLMLLIVDTKYRIFLLN